MISAYFAKAISGKKNTGMGAGIAKPWGFTCIVRTNLTFSFKRESIVNTEQEGI